jgi:excisionase family DNA binding protein
MKRPSQPIAATPSPAQRHGGGLKGGTRAVRVPPAGSPAEGTTLLLRPIEVAATLGISRSKVFELLAARELPSIHIGRSTRVPQAQLSEWISCQVRWEPRAARGLLARLKSTDGCTD